MLKSRYAFLLRPIPLLATIVVAALGIVLGNWQSGRAQEKQALADRLHSRTQAAPLVIAAVPRTAELLPEEAEFRRVRVRGRFLAGASAYLDNRPHGGKPGFYVLMPLRVQDSQRTVWVARGWIERNLRDRAVVPPYATPAGEVEIEGVAVRSLGKVMQLGTPPAIVPGAVLQNLDLPQLDAAHGLKSLPFFVQQSSDGKDGLVRDWPQPSLGIDKHRGYAFQWYGLAAMAVVFFIVTGWRRGRKVESNGTSE
ncbi:MAG TPA: SURF1 family protein [Burkholderiaceae bacterium]